MRRSRLLPVLALAAGLVACQSGPALVDPTLPGAYDGFDAPGATPRPAATGTPTPASAKPTTPAASLKPTVPQAGEPDEVEAGEGAGNIIRLTAPDNKQGQAAVHVALQLPLFSVLPSARTLALAKVVLKRDGVLLNSTIATAEVEGSRIIDGVASVQVEKCEAGAYILNVETFDEAGKALGAAQHKFKLELGGAKQLAARMAYMFEGGNTSLKVRLEETPALYVQGGMPDGMTVLWQSGATVSSKVVLNDEAGAYVTNKTGAAGRRHQLRFTGLTAGKSYQYVAYEGDTEVGRGGFTTSLGPSATKFRFAALGDTGQGTSAQFAVGRRMGDWKPAFVLHTGDVIYPNGEASSYGPFFIAPYRDLIQSTVFYPSLGNHDYRTNKAQPYLDFFEAPRANLDDTERYYRFRHGNAEFFSLDTNQAYAKGSAQYTWLESQLKASTATWKIPFFHHPPYSSGEHGSSAGVRSALGPLFEQHKVQLVLTGHDHHYERTKPQNGVVYVVTGGGGAAMRSVKPQAFAQIAQAKHHFVGLSVDGESLVLEAVDDQGKVFDSTTLRAK